MKPTPTPPTVKIKAGKETDHAEATREITFLLSAKVLDLPAIQSAVNRRNACIEY